MHKQGPQTPARRVSAAEQPYLFSEDNSRFGRAVSLALVRRCSGLLPRWLDVPVGLAFMMADVCLCAQVREMKAFLDWEDRSTFAKVIAPFEFPFAVALRVTIPLVEHKTWSRTFSALCIVRTLQCPGSCQSLPTSSLMNL